MTDIIKPVKATIILDASKIDLDETCPRRYEFRYIRKKVLPMISKATALDLGSLAHAGLEVYFKSLAEGQKYNDRMNLMLLTMKSMASDPNQSSLDPDEAENLIRAVEQSCDYWRSEDENSIEVLAVEAPFAYELYEDDDIRIIISGKIDLLCNFHGIGRSASYDKMPIDHKTYSRDSMLLRKSNQFINYCSATESNFLVVNRIGLQTSKSAEDKFKRLPLSYDPIYIAAWKDNLTKMILQEYLTCVANNYWPEKPTSCNKFNRLCEYYKVCDSSGSYEDKLAKLEIEYVDGEEWDVTKGLE